jgi:nickel-dependent lactate racemase
MSHTTVTFPYGTYDITFELPTSNLLGVIIPKMDRDGKDEDQIVREALANPINSPRLCDLAHGRKSVAIVISDITRPCPTSQLLPHILGELESAGIKDSNILINIALGIHRKMNDAEIATIVNPTIANRIRVTNHEPEDTIHLGHTSAGTPVEIFRPITEADLRICIGNIEHHYFAGFSGGNKAVFPGCASKATISANHAMMFHPNATAGKIDDNPVRVDIEEGASLVPVDFILNVVLDPNQRIIDAVAGHSIAAHREGCKLVDERFAVLIPKRADIVLAGAGGHPKDINLYQAHKGLDNALCFAKKNGLIIFVAQCREGFGNPVFEGWMKEGVKSEDLISRIQQEFILGGHKAAALASVLKRTTVCLLSDLAPDVVRRIGMVPVRNTQEILKIAFDKMGGSADMLVVPHASSVHPIFPDEFLFL